MTHNIWYYVFWFWAMGGFLAVAVTSQTYQEIYLEKVKSMKDAFDDLGIGPKWSMRLLYIASFVFSWYAAFLSVRAEIFIRLDMRRNKISYREAIERWINRKIAKRERTSKDDSS